MPPISSNDSTATTRPIQTLDAVFTDPIIHAQTELQSAKFVLGREHDNKAAWEMYKRQQGCLWTAEEIILSTDKVQFEKLLEGEQLFIKNVLAFFACADGIVSENIVMNMQAQCQQSSVQAFYALQTYIEKVHQEVYNDLILSLVRDPKEQDRLFSAIDNDPGIRAKTDWALRWLNNNDASFAEKLVAFACVEGIMFSSSFCAIYYLKSRGREMPGLFASNHFIQRDEALHTEFACLLHNQLQPANQCSKERIMEIVLDALAAECIFVKSSLRLDLIGMNSSMMIEYVKFVANTLLHMLKAGKLEEKVFNPFIFMESISLQSKANFFENTESNYATAGVGVPENEREFRLDADF